MKRAPKTLGFTLIELLVVIAIIGMLSSIALASLNTARSKARDAQRFSDMHQISLALELYRLQYGSYPLSTACSPSAWCRSREVVTNSWIPGLAPFMGGSVPETPIPYGNPFTYHYTSYGPGYFLMTGMENPEGTCAAGKAFFWHYDGTTNVCAWWGGNLYAKSVLSI